MRNKEFSKYQEKKKEEYLKKYGTCFLYEVKNDIKVLSPAKVKIIWEGHIWKAWIRKLLRL